MRSELNELALIDTYLLKQLDPEVTRAFEAGLLMNEAFAEKVETQRMAHRLIRLYGRMKERNRLERIYQELLNEPVFSNQLKDLL